MMPRSLFDKSNTPAPIQRQSDPKKNSVVGLLLIIIIGFGVFTAYNAGWIELPDQIDAVVDDNEPDSTPNVEPAGPDGTPLSDCVLIVIRDKREISKDVEYTTTMLDDEFWMGVSGRVKDLEVVSPDDDQAKQFLERNELTHPVVCLVDSNTKTVLWQIPLPKGGTDPIKEKLFNE